MIARFQSPEGIRSQIAEGYRYYIVQAGDSWAGFLAFYPRGERMYLSKFYLDRSFRGMGLSGRMFAFVRQQTEQEGLSAIYLNVNRFNSDVIAVYHHFGFHCVCEEQNDIGNGFVMDDKVMEYPMPLGDNGEWLWMTETADGLDRDAFLSIFRESSVENARPGILTFRKRKLFKSMNPISGHISAVIFRRKAGYWQFSAIRAVIVPACGCIRKEQANIILKHLKPDRTAGGWDTGEDCTRR